MSRPRSTVVRALAAFAVTVALAACDTSSTPTTSPLVAGTLVVRAASSGVDVDSSGYLVALDNGTPAAIAVNGAVTFQRVVVGQHQVTLGYVGSNCVVGGGATQTVTVTSGAPDTLTIAVTCVARRLVFESDRDGNTEIYAMNTDGTGLVRLTNDAGADVLPAWSPDSATIAFSSDRSHPGGLDIWVMHPDGTSPTQLTAAAGESGAVSWSPDGTRIAFASTRTDTVPGHAEIWVSGADGSNPVQLTTDDSLANNPGWSPDGTKLVFQSNRSGTDQIWVMNADGSGLTNLSNDASNDAYPSWSPDGTKIVFQSDRDASQADPTNVEVYVMNADGSGQTRLTNSPGVDGVPSWSSDGKVIVFDSDRSGTTEVWRMRPNGTLQTQITTDASNNGYARFAP